MTLCVGVGYSEQADSNRAGIEAAQAAISRAGDGACRLVLLFSTSKHNPEALRDAVRSVVGPAPRLVGGYGVGVITAQDLGYDGYQVGIAAFVGDSGSFDLFIQSGLNDNEYETGAALGRQ